MDTEALLIPAPDGHIILGIPTHFGVMPVMSFNSLDDLRRFAMGILGFCEYHNPSIPDVFLKAFGDKGV